ncbi:MAG: U32 family peptidase [DPANN group archaeon]|nr:U32 family peptidase [DPANN group archaeon]
MSGFSFWVPFNGDFKLLEELKVHFANDINGNKIEGLYFPASQEYFGSARVVKKLTIDNAKKVIDFCKNMGWKSNMLMNSSCGGADWYSPKTISKTLLLIKNMKLAGLTSITITNPIYLQKIKKEIPDINIIVSVISEIESVQRAKFFEDLGADSFVPDRDINRNLELLKEIKDSTDMNMILMVNEGCLYRCPQRNIHYNFISHWSTTEKEKYSDFMTNYCVNLRGVKPEELLKMQFILPQHLKHYACITSSFKIVGRTRSTKDILQITKAYLAEKWDGNILDLMSSATPSVRDKYGYGISANTLDDIFFKKVTTCDNNCEKCNFCKNFTENISSS